MVCLSLISHVERRGLCISSWIYCTLFLSYVQVPAATKWLFCCVCCVSFSPFYSQVRFTAFGERFDISLTPLRSVVGIGSRVRALGAGGEILTDRKPRLCTYEGRLPHGGWVRAVVRSTTSVTVHFLHKVRPTNTRVHRVRV